MRVYVTEIKGPAFQKKQKVLQLKLLWEEMQLKQADYAERHRMAVLYWHDDLINDPEIDAIYIATPLIRINTTDQWIAGK
jgi:predicted dehydrogenase